MFDKETILPILLTVMCALLLAVVLLFGFNTGRFDFLKNKNQKQVAVQKEEEKIVRTDYTDVARKTLDWIDQQRNEEGWYILVKNCSYKNKTCDEIWDNKEGNKDGLIATWARLSFYEQHKNPKDLEIVKKDIDLFYEKYKDDDLKDSLWLCKITYEMAQSEYLDQGQKNKLEKMCFSLVTPKIISDNDSYIKKTKEMEKLAGEDTILWENWIGYNLGFRGFDNYFGLTSDLISQYRWKKDEKKLVEAKKHFESIETIIEQIDFSVKPEDDCLVGLSALDLYEFGGKDINLLNYAKRKYMTFSDIKGNIKKYRTTICGLFSKRLYQVTKDDLFLNGTEKNNKLLMGLWDGGESLAKTTGESGFYIASVNGVGFPFKNIVENGLIVELIRN